MSGLDFLGTAIFFSLLGYSLCYLNIKAQESKNNKINEQLN